MNHILLLLVAFLTQNTKGTSLSTKSGGGGKALFSPCYLLGLKNRRLTSIIRSVQESVDLWGSCLGVENSLDGQKNQLMTTQCLLPSSSCVPTIQHMSFCPIKLLVAVASTDRREIFHLVSGGTLLSFSRS